MASTKIDINAAARVLVDAYFATDQTAARKHGISTKTVQRHRQRLETEPKLSTAYHNLLQTALDQDWAAELNETVKTALRKLRDTIQQIKTDTPEGATELLALTRGLVELDFSKQYAEVELEQARTNHLAPNQTPQRDPLPEETTPLPN